MTSKERGPRRASLENLEILGCLRRILKHLTVEKNNLDIYKNVTSEGADKV